MSWTFPEIFSWKCPGHFLPGRVHIFPSSPFITDIPIEAFLVALDVPGQI